MNVAALVWIGCVLSAGLTGSVLAQGTGLEALGVLVREKGVAAGGQVVLLAGDRGAEQPGVWRVVTRDPVYAGRFREYLVKAGRVVAEQAVPAAESGALATAPLVREKIRIDSPIVFWRAHTEAKKALIGFDMVDYELRNAEFSTRPVWVVRLRRKAGTQVGELAVSAESGNVLRRTWFEAGRKTETRAATVSQPKRQLTSEALSDTAQQAWQGTRTGIKEGTKAVKTGLSKASTTVGGWLIRAGGGTPPASTAPSTSTVPRSGAKPAAGTPAPPANRPVGPVPPPPQTGGPATWERGAYDSGAKR